MDLCIEFTNMDIGRESDRIAGDTEEFETLGGEIPKYVLSVHPGRPLALLVETAVKLLAQDNAGFNAERVLIANYNKAIAA